MIEKALKYIVGLKAPDVLDIGGQMYSDKPLERISYSPKAQAIGMTTLTSLVEYVKANIDTMSEKMIVHVSSPKNVKLYSMLDHDRVREYMVEVNAQVPEFRYGRYMEHEEFLIALQSKFIRNDDLDLLMKFAGTVEDGTVTSYGDDGVTQKATVKTESRPKARLLYQIRLISGRSEPSWK